MPVEMKVMLFSGHFLGALRLMIGIFQVQLNDSRILRSVLFVNGLRKESGADFLTDGSSDSMGGGTFDRSIPVTF